MAFQVCLPDVITQEIHALITNCLTGKKKNPDQKIYIFSGTSDNKTKGQAISF